MPAVADYIIARDSSVTIPQSGSIKFWEKDLDSGSGTRHDARMILQFFYVSSSDADKLEFRFRIRGNNETEWTNIRTIRVSLCVRIVLELFTKFSMEARHFHLPSPYKP